MENSAIKIVEDALRTLYVNDRLIVSTSFLEQYFVKFGLANYEKLHNSSTYMRKFRLYKAGKVGLVKVTEVPAPNSLEKHYKLSQV
jgi:hypothetical protein